MKTILQLRKWSRNQKEDPLFLLEFPFDSRRRQKNSHQRPFQAQIGSPKLKALVPIPYSDESDFPDLISLGNRNRLADYSASQKSSNKQLKKKVSATKMDCRKPGSARKSRGSFYRLDAPIRRYSNPPSQNYIA